MVRQGLYAAALARWMRVFPPSQFLVVTREAHERTPLATVRAIENFLDLPAAKWSPELLTSRRNVNDDGRDPVNPIHVSDHAWVTLRELYRPHTAWLVRLLSQTSSPPLPPWNLTMHELKSLA
jgi:hypothetical protein